MDDIPKQTLEYFSAVTARSLPFHWTGYDTLTIIAVVLLVLLASLLAVAETSLTRITRVKAMALADMKVKRGSVLLKILENQGSFLNPVLLVAVFSQLVAATMVGALAGHLFGALGLAVSTAFEVVVIFILAEAIPKNWAVRNPERAALFAAPMVRSIIRFPLVRLMSNIILGLTNILLRGKSLPLLGAVSEEELLAMADAALEEDVIETEERELIHSIISFGDTVAREVMVPRTDMIAVEASARVDEVLQVALDAGYSRIPVYKETIDDVIGVVLAKDLMRADRESKSNQEVVGLVRSAHFVPETKPVSNLLREMQAGKFHIAIVFDEYGGTSGLVTLEDLIEELVGDITDEFDKDVVDVEKISENEYLIVASKSLDELNDQLGIELPEGEWDTVGGLFLSLLGHLPAEGEQVDLRNYRLTAEKVINRRIGRVRLATIEEKPFEEAR
ncbi:MAG: HlyC/CorC family transporter [Acidimicrobiaceae bacterium]|nr:HlyC/CorC family transporter [Acidimicrobiaceae bacterium]